MRLVLQHVPRLGLFAAVPDADGRAETLRQSGGGPRLPCSWPGGAQPSSRVPALATLRSFGLLGPRGSVKLYV